MKKQLILLVVLLLSLSLAACGGDKKRDEGENNDKTPTVTIGQADDGRDDSNGEDVTPTEAPTPTPTKKVEIADFDTSAEITEVILVDEKEFKITAKELTYTKNTVALGLEIENLGDDELSFQCNNSINGYMVDSGYLYEDVSSGKKAKVSIEFAVDELLLYGITSIADVCINFEVENSDYDVLYDDACKLETSLAKSHDYTKNYYRESIASGALEHLADATVEYIEEKELYNQEGVSVVSKALITNEDGEQMVFLEVVNSTDEIVYGVITDIVVNGVTMYDGTWSNAKINPGATRIMDIEIESVISYEPLEAYGISEIANIQFGFSVKDVDYDDFADEAILDATISDADATLDLSGSVVYDDNDIRIISKGFYDSLVSYNDDIHWMLLVENKREEEITIWDEYDSASLNGYMIEYSFYGLTVMPGGYAVIDIDYEDDSLEENDIAAIGDITEAEVSIEIKNADYDDIDNTTLKITVE